MVTDCLLCKAYDLLTFLECINKELVLHLFHVLSFSYPALEGVAALCVHTIIGHHIFVGIIHVATVASMVAIGD